MSQILDFAKRLQVVQDELRTSVRSLQRKLDVRVDGVIGPETMAAAERVAYTTDLDRRVHDLEAQVAQLQGQVKP